jgi:beta-glucuronidase
MKTKARLFAAIAAILAMTTAQAAEVPLVGNILNRQTTTLNGRWNYIIDVQEEGYYDYRMNPTSWGFFRNDKPKRPEDLIEYDFDKAATMQIPGDWNTQDDRLFFYEGTVWFKRSFNYKKSEGQSTLLYFGAVNYDTHVYVNGQHVTHHVGGFTPFNADVTEQLKDGENVVIVKVDNKRHADNVPTQIFDWWNYGGITRDVLLVQVPKTYIENYKLALSKEIAKKGVRTIDFALNLNAKEAGRQVTLSIPELKIKQLLVTDAEGCVSTSFDVKQKMLTLWSPESPKLYKVEMILDGDTLRDEIGFRTVETRGKQLLLNGQPIFLRGVSIHEEAPNGGGRANGTETARTLLSWAKELGCNFVRLAHYPHNEYMIREAERQGILVWSEIPVYWTISWKNEKTYQNAQRQLTDMIRRDQNRANIIIWSIANETPHSPERDKFLGNLAQYARTLDNTRLISMAMEVTSASNYHNRLQDNMHQYVDIVAFNQYIGWYRDVNDAPKMTWEVPYEKPVIVSEFGGGAKAGYHGEKNQRWTEEFQENLYIQNTAMLDKIEGLAGTTPWVLKDFRSPRRVLDGIQDYYNRKGLYSDRGEKKKAFFVLKQWYEGKK